MRRNREFAPFRVLTLIFVCLTPLLPLIGPAPAMAQGEMCPEGLVYLPTEDRCVLLENVPPGVEFIDQHAGTSGVGEATDTEDASDGADTTGTDEDMDPGVADDTTDDEPGIADDGTTDDGPGIAEDPTATIRNLTVLTFACPVNWNPATRPIESSREMCTEPILPGMTYTILFEGQEVLVAEFGVEIDMVNGRKDINGVSPPLPAGMWTIRENLQEGLEDPFAFCAIYAADGSTRLTVMETVRGGALDIQLAAGEEVNCEWYSVASVPEVAAPPSLGLEVMAFGCPAPAEFSGGLDDCTLPLPGPVTFEAIYGGQVVHTATLDSAEVAHVVDPAALSGEWTIRPIVQEGWIDPHLTCTSVTDIGENAGQISYFPPADGSLGVTVRLNPDQRARCHIWLFAGDTRESVMVVTRDCLEDYDAATLSPGVREATCPRLQFQSVSVAVDGAAPVQVESTRNGVAVFPIQSGTWRITVDTQAGVVGRAVTFVTCDQTFAALGQVQTIEPTINSDKRSVSIDMDEGDALRCDFFFGPDAAPAMETGDTEAVPAEADPADDTGTGAETDEPEPAPDGDTFGGGTEHASGDTEPESDDDTGEAAGPSDTTMGDEPPGEPISDLTLQSYACPEGIDPKDGAADLDAICSVDGTPAFTYTITVGGDGLGTHTLQAEGGSPGAVSFSSGDKPMPSGTLLITLTPLEGWTTGLVNCTLTAPDGTAQLVQPPFSGEAVQLAVSPEDSVSCDWFMMVGIPQTDAGTGFARGYIGDR